MTRFLILSAVLLIPSSAAFGQITLKFDSTRSALDARRNIVRFDSCYVMVPKKSERMNQHSGDIIELKWSPLTNQVLSIRRGNYSLAGESFTIDWLGPNMLGPKTKEVSSIKRPKNISRYNMAYTYSVLDHDDKVQIGDKFVLRSISWSSLPPAIRQAAYEATLPHLPPHIRDAAIKFRQLMLRQIGEMLN